MDKTRVAVNGYGVIGRRVVDAVALQEDMEIVGIADVAGDYRLRRAQARGLAVYAAAAGKQDEMTEAGIDVRGTLDDLLRGAEVVVDCTPKGVDATNTARYEGANLKYILHGGAKHALTGHSFVASANYASAIGRNSTRVVSCNTTATVRTLTALHDAGLLHKARGVLIRRASDPSESHLTGIINTMVPEKMIPSHQGPDAKTVVPELDVVTMAVTAPQNVGHLHYWTVELSRRASRDEVLAALSTNTRIAFIRAGDGVAALNVTADLMLELDRPRGAMWEVALWEDILTVQGQEAYYAYQVDNQAIVIPETIDAIRALVGREKSAQASIALTDHTLGVRQRFA